MKPTFFAESLKIQGGQAPFRRPCTWKRLQIAQGYGFQGASCKIKAKKSCACHVWCKQGLLRHKLN